MRITNKRVLFSFLIIGIPFFILVGMVAQNRDLLPQFSFSSGQSVHPTVLGLFSAPTTTPTSSPTATPLPTPTVIPYTISLVRWPEGELIEGDIATFTWEINGPPIVIQTTAVYYGMTGTPGTLTRIADPESTQYTGATADFLNGDYLLPMRFVANIPRVAPGNYYFRGYAGIEGKHYWTNELTFAVRKKPRHEITIIDYPKTTTGSSSISFTWEISGPAAETGFTAIMAGKESRPGPLDPSVDTTMTPYRVIVNDFTHGTAKVPLRFIGNAAIHEPGVYYFRAVVFINDKNIWSDEQTFTIQ